MLKLLIFNFLHLSDRLNVVTCCFLNLAGRVSSSQLLLSGSHCRQLRSACVSRGQFRDGKRWYGWRPTFHSGLCI